ncbi:hypothetical protein BU25DRAFT_417646 [Macroventuria anomochaeta]|uniref:Uncharacterized protein n=1 Tax=Macroventuria anomochaeta TaxID=301207 RepID=A0ACB6SIZ5_9PLEO|nr:uncharacterized protein BU25DRAFT_417646 [Macroventuria anomochaeta]KAF2633127.1 hypothetical protein BU25DRAFT_417646 [Macroventuria anomochaeta]
METLVLSAFENTGIYPLKPDIILDRFKKSTPPPPMMPQEQTKPQPASSSQLATLITDLEQAIQAKKKRSKKKKVLPLSPRDPNVQGGAIFYDPLSKARAVTGLWCCSEDAEKKELEEEAARADKKQLQYNNKLLREKTKAENAEKAAQKHEETAQKRAQEEREQQARKAEKERVRELKNAQKASKLPKQARKKASKKLQSKISKGGGGAARRRPQVAHEPSSAPQGVETRSDCVTRPTEKLR